MQSKRRSAFESLSQGSAIWVQIMQKLVVVGLLMAGTGSAAYAFSVGPILGLNCGGASLPPCSAASLLPQYEEVHQNITEQALQGIQLPNPHGPSLGSISFSSQALLEIERWNAYTDYDQTSHENHFDDNHLEEGLQRLRNLKAHILAQLAQPLSSQNPQGRIRFRFGTYLHTLQDFFAHTNWVERQVPHPLYPDFDTVSFMNIDRFSVFPCVPTSSTRFYPTYDNELISGYAGSLSDLQSGNAPPGQCTHGLLVNGIHKDWPGRLGYIEARVAAAVATHTNTLDILQDPGNNPDTVCEFMTDNPCPTGPTLNVFKQGSGSGTVTSSPSGIQCGPTCNTSFVVNTTVTLTATPDSGSVFTGWSDDCLGPTPVYFLPMDQDKSCTATFSSGNPTLTVVKQGSGSGTVTSSPSGIQCDSSCSTSNASFAVNTSVTLTATPDSGWVFNGWSGDCVGTNSVFPLEPVQDLDQGMQRKAKLAEKAQHTCSM